MMPSTPLQLTVLDHPLVQHKMSLLRDRGTNTRDFKELVAELGMLLAYEATRDLPAAEVTIETPLEKTKGRQVDGKNLVLVPILRAGLGFVDGITRLLPTARVGHVGLYRDHDTLAPHEYYFKLPPSTPATRWLLLDPMLATGGSAVAAVGKLKEAGAKDIRFLCLVAAPEGVRALTAAHPDILIFAAALDRQLNEVGYILPGLGDAGDRLFGTK
jgi:uracil phosphoribosyltransferase